MSEKLKSLILKFIFDIYPGVEREMIFLTGSRSLGIQTASSDIDILIIVEPEKYERYSEYSQAHGFRKKEKMLV